MAYTVDWAVRCLGSSAATIKSVSAWMIEVVARCFPSPVNHAPRMRTGSDGASIRTGVP
jgi:hypothetical protein